jgi:hypothetical protein
LVIVFVFLQPASRFKTGAKLTCYYLRLKNGGLPGPLENLKIMKYNPLKPYNDLPDLLPTADIETKIILKKIIAGRTV